MANTATRRPPGPADDGRRAKARGATLAVLLAASFPVLTLAPGTPGATTAHAGSFETLFGEDADPDEAAPPRQEPPHLAEGPRGPRAVAAWDRPGREPDASYDRARGYGEGPVGDGRDDGYNQDDRYGRDARRPRPASATRTPRRAEAPEAPITPLDDGTLERGDIVMTAGGPVVYMGPDGDGAVRTRHDPSDFESPRQARRELDPARAHDVARAERDARLAREAADMAPTTGRSAAVAPATAGATVDDGRGHPIRYVGP